MHTKLNNAKTQNLKSFTFIAKIGYKINAIVSYWIYGLGAKTSDT